MKADRPSSTSSSTSGDPLTAATTFLRWYVDLVPKVGVIVGSGMEAVADQVEPVKAMPVNDLPGMPRGAGPRRMLTFGRWAGTPVAVLGGRFHLYEGYTAREVVFPVELFARLGAKIVVLMAAAGALATDARPGTILLITDHLNLTGQVPLPPGAFVEMAGAYDPELATLAWEAGSALGLTMARGVLAAVAGPNYETPAEAEMLRRAGADAVCMSTVPEVMMARSLGLRVLALAVLTNAAGQAGLTHGAVVAEAKQQAVLVGRLIGQVLTRLTPA